MLNAVQMTWRRLSRRPGFAVVAVLSMGLGIGLAAVSAKLLDDLLYRVPAHVRGGNGARSYAARAHSNSLRCCRFSTAKCDVVCSATRLS